MKPIYITNVTVTSPNQFRSNNSIWNPYILPMLLHQTSSEVRIPYETHIYILPMLLLLHQTSSEVTIPYETHIYITNVTVTSPNQFRSKNSIWNPYILPMLLHQTSSEVTIPYETHILPMLLLLHQTSSEVTIPYETHIYYQCYCYFTKPVPK